MGMKILLCLTLASGLMPSIANGAESDGSYGGRIETRRPYEGMIKTDLGEPIYLEVRTPELFGNLSVGDRLTIQLNGDGQVDKVMGMPVPELGITGQPMPRQP
jgi:hypothetical protein